MFALDNLRTRYERQRIAIQRAADLGLLYDRMYRHFDQGGQVVIRRAGVPYEGMDALNEIFETAQRQAARFDGGTMWLVNLLNQHRHRD